MSVITSEVRMWGSPVGALVYDTDRQLGSFEYFPGWVKNGVDIAPIHMPIAAKKIYAYPSLNEATYKGLPAVFADTLPDDFGHAVINAWLAGQGRNIGTFTPLERLLYTNNRGMGALEYYPGINQQSPSSISLELNSLVEMAQQILDQRADLNVSVTPARPNNEAMNALFLVGTSAGGARPKALIAVNSDRTEIRSGQAEIPVGFEHYLLKFDGVTEGRQDKETFGDPRGYGRMEYAYYLMAKDAGINISHSELLRDGERAHFMTKRFDRDGKRKLHYVSLCAMDHADFKKPGFYSYEELIATARKLKLKRADVTDLYRRMVFNVIARNHDAHSKNFGFILDSESARWRLSPAFDVAYSYKVDSPWVSQHQLSINGKRDAITRHDLLSVATLLNNFEPEAKEIITSIRQVVMSWRDYASQAGVFDWFVNEIEKNHRTEI